MMRYYSHGKILLSGEYSVLHGAQALALPTQRGQSLTIIPSQGKNLDWISHNVDSEIWFEATFSLTDLSLIHTNNPAVGKRLETFLQYLRQQQNEFCRTPVQAETILEFDRQWGLGSSSTLLSNLARWADCDPFSLLDHTLGGSGYDIACALADGPICFQRIAGRPLFKAVEFDPPFKNELYFVYLNQKQDSQKEVEQYLKKKPQLAFLEKISNLTHHLINCKDLENFQTLLTEHETLMSSHLKRPRLQEEYFPDFTGVIKSLGAWGGDFVLASGGRPDYFKEKGFKVVMGYSEFIL